jgi:hypothetical protein
MHQLAQRDPHHCVRHARMGSSVCVVSVALYCSAQWQNGEDRDKMTGIDSLLHAG